MARWVTSLFKKEQEMKNGMMKAKGAAKAKMAKGAAKKVDPKAAKTMRGGYAKGGMAKKKN